MADIRTNGWEWLHYDNPDFQVQYRKNMIPAHANLTDVKMHWHDDVEFIYVVQGSIYYNMDNEKVLIREGEGIFVNARQKHVIEASFEDCTLYCLIFHPLLLCSSEYVATNVVVPVLENKKMPYCLLSETEPWQCELLQTIRNMQPHVENESGHMQVMQDIYAIWDLLYKNLIYGRDVDDNNRELVLLKKMVAFIHKNYRKKIKLREICEAGNVGRTKCDEIFAIYYNLTPIEYLRNYRIEKGAYLMEITDMSITEIAYEVGFNDAGYFSKVFKQQIGCNPQSYRSYGKGMSKYYEQSRCQDIHAGIQNTTHKKHDL